MFDEFVRIKICHKKHKEHIRQSTFLPAYFFFCTPVHSSAPDEFIRGQAPACIVGTDNKPFRASQHFPSILSITFLGHARKVTVEGLAIFPVVFFWAVRRSAVLSM
jgi:hypothetical protein